MMVRLRSEFGVEQLTIQTGGTLNSEFIRAGLVDRLQIVMAPILVGGQQTPSLIGGSSLLRVDELLALKVLKLRSNKTLANSYLQLEYDVLPETTVI
jgi:2,5-diamino-6-(ribosylamino)-4(3H)-pyrimidinone 5'-phosphate reductase